MRKHGVKNNLQTPNTSAKNRQLLCFVKTFIIDHSIKAQTYTRDVMIHQSTEKRKHAETGALGHYCTTVGKFIQQPLQTEKLMEMNNGWRKRIFYAVWCSRMARVLNQNVFFLIVQRYHQCDLLIRKIVLWVIKTFRDTWACSLRSGGLYLKKWIYSKIL